MFWSHSKSPGNECIEYYGNALLCSLYGWHTTIPSVVNEVLGNTFLENLSIVVVVTLAMASIAVLCLLASAENIHFPIQHVGN